jgi:hypothetical protein
MKNTFSLLLMTLALIVAPLVSIAQGPGDPPPFGIPIDGGASLLVAAGIGFGIKKYVDYRKQQKQK